MAHRTPDGPPPPPVVQRIRLRYAKRGRLRFTSHRDFARAFERAVRRAAVPMAYSAGFSPHPKISYVGASPTGVASEAEYLEIGLAREVDVEQLRQRLDAMLPDGLDLVDAVIAGPGSLADRMQASSWRIELPGVSVERAAQAVASLLAAPEVNVERMTKSGRRTIDVRAAIVAMTVEGADIEAATIEGANVESATQVGSQTHPDDATSADVDHPRAILAVVVRQVIPAVRPDDVVTALLVVAGLAPVAPPVAVRLAQGPLGDDATIGDPLAADHGQTTT